MSRESTPKTVFVATALAVVCSMLVSTAAVGLRSQQQANKLLEKQKNILMAAGAYEPGMDVPKAFESFEPAVVDLKTGEYVPRDEVDPATYDQREAASDPSMSVAIPPEVDKPRIVRRAKYGLIYKVLKDGKTLLTSQIYFMKPNERDKLPSLTSRIELQTTDLIPTESGEFETFFRIVL